jgi:lycopene beta-cyclase
VSIPAKIIELDIAIIGGGSSGMALATRLNGLSATVFEPKTAAERDCCWAFWAHPPQLKEFSQSIQGSWDRWRIIDHNDEIIHHSNQYRYTCLSAKKHLEHCETNLKKSTSLVRSPVENLVPKGNGGQFNANGQRYSAKTIYDSRPPTMAENSLRQHFLGWEISLKEPMENADIATLMDFRVDQSRGLHFIYVLPYSDRHLLVESTMISTQLEDKGWYRNAITGWLAEHNIQVKSQLREEYGVISMATEQPYNPEVNNIGANGGAVRLSSGYAFSTIQRQMAELAQSINAGQRNVPKPFSRLLMFMDKVFNRALNAQPDQGVSFFMATAKALNAEQFSLFMLGDAGFLEWAKVMQAMPKWPFIKSALSQIFSHD